MSIQEEFQLWKNRIAVAKKHLQKQSEDWKLFLDAYYGKIKRVDGSESTKCDAAINLFYVDVRNSGTRLYPQNPNIFIDPETPEADFASEALELIVNNKLEDWKLKEVVRAAVKRTKLDGRCYIKTSYKFETDKIGREYVGDEPNDDITLNLVLRKNLLIDPFATSVKSARWVAHIVTDQISAIRKKFKIKAEQKVSVIESMDLPKDLSDEEKEDFQYGVYYEIEDRVSRKLSIIVEGLDEFAEEPYVFPYGFYSMYDPLEWNDLPCELDTKADLHFWYDLLVSLNDIRIHQIKHLRKLNSKYISTGATELTDEQKRDITSYEDATIVQLKPTQTVQPWQHATLGQEVYAGENTLRQDITIISGLNEMKQGLPMVQKTAREAMAIYQNAQDLVGDRNEIIEEFIKSIIVKCIWFIQNNYDSTRIIKLTGREDVEFMNLKDRLKGQNGKPLVEGNKDRPFLKFVGSELTGQVKVRIKSGSIRPVSEEQRREDITQLISLISTNQQIATSIDSKELTKEVSKILHIENKGIVMDPKTPEQENILLKRNVPVMPHMNEDHSAHLAVHERDGSNTDAAINHRLAHKLMKSFIDKAQPQASPMPIKGGGNQELSLEGISGFPRGNTPEPFIPTQGQGVTTLPENPQLPEGIQ